MFYFAAVFLVAMFINHPVLLLEALVGALLFCAVLERGRIWKSLLLYLPVVALITLLNPLFSQNGDTVLFAVFDFTITLEALLSGAAVAGMLAAVMLWFRCYTAIMTTDKFLYLFGRTIPKVSLILSTALRLVPMFKRQYLQVSRAQRAMGLYTGRRLSTRLRAGGRVFLVLMTWSLENAIETGDSMRARGYGMKGRGQPGRTRYSLFRWTARDGLLLLVTVLLLAATLAGRAFGGAAFVFYPQLSGLDPSPLSLSIYLAFGLLACLPFFIEVEEMVQWTCFVSKI